MSEGIVEEMLGSECARFPNLPLGMVSASANIPPPLSSSFICVDGRTWL